MVSLNRRLYDRIVAHQGRECCMELISTHASNPGRPGAAAHTAQPTDLSTVWPRFAVLDNPDLPDLLVDPSLMHALQVVLRPSRMRVDYPICLGAAAHRERAAVRLQDAGQSMHTRAKGRLVALYPPPQATAGGGGGEE
mmetsp:Transcript_20910/g.53587  ORF Transcript_20910/g.53587 Transcript_20910/m.53587 type:complete len:139 (+) Transcript_20910:201-617(+)